MDGEDERQQDLGRRLSALEAEMADRLGAMEANLEAFIQQGLTERIARLEDALTLVTDVERYQRLQMLLKTGKLFEADEETLHVLLQEAGTPDREDLTPDAVKQFPCSVLRVIDRLWTTYTGGRFGFSVQLRLYQQVGGTLDTAISQDLTLLRKLGEQVGWRDQDQWKTIDQAPHQLNDPIGCYPVIWWDSPYGAKMVNYFLVRLFTCAL
jgi:hypothetical protein